MASKLCNVSKIHENNNREFIYPQELMCICVNKLTDKICITHNECLIFHHKALKREDYNSRSTKFGAPSVAQILDSTARILIQVR